MRSAPILSSTAGPTAGHTAAWASPPASNGNAVKRNRARRRIRELYRGEEQALLPGYDIVVVARTRVIYGKYADLQRSFRRLTEKLELRRGREAGEAL